jgi:two-component system sensor kinase FixL
MESGWARSAGKPFSDDRAGSWWRRMFRPAPKSPARWVVAVAAVAGAVGLRAILQSRLGANVPFLQFFPAILGAAWWGGLGAGLLATGLSTVIAMYWFLPPEGFGVGSTADILSLGLFVLIGAAISWINDRLQRAEGAHREASTLATGRAERLDAIINTTVDGIIVIDDRGCIEAFNRGAERLFGYPAAEVIGRNVNMLMPSPYHGEHDAYLRRYVTTGEARIIGTGREVAGRRRDGSTFPVHLSVGEMTVGGERKFTGMLHDLTARVRLEQQLRASEARWRAVIESAVDGIIVIDEHGRIEAFNPAAERLFGYSEADVVGRNVDMLMPSPYREEHDGYLTRYMATGRAKIIGSGREVTGLRRDGTTFPLHLSVGQVVIEGERRFTGILHDLSRRVRIEEQLREQASLARVGEMAAVLAHEIKNPLAGIRGAMQVMSTRMPAGSADAAMTREIISRIDALDGLMKDLLLFARPPTPKRRPIELVPLVGVTATLLKEDAALAGVDIEIEGTAPAVSADPDMLKMVFQNVLVNGAHAMNGRGRIHVDVQPAENSCRIVFTDSGPGIPDDIRDKVFTPFFTTKSRGTGLGLPTVKRLIDAHQGSIAIDCPPTGGTVVSIQLPIDGE